MDIGKKIQSARLQAKLTQEQAAEALGVSRQSVSNWENSKTYPDIISVIKMSDIYHISLDLLLKEEQPMSDYMDYLKKSTDVVSSNDHKGKLVLICSYLVVWAFSLIFFWFMKGAEDAMGFSITFLWVILPITTLVVSIFVGKHNYWGNKKWLFALFAGVMYCAAEYGTFSMSNMVSFDKFNIPEFSMILVGAVISGIGIYIGTIFAKKKN